jgi:tetratricopeptide (TPR) repeat protein
MKHFYTASLLTLFVLGCATQGQTAAGVRYYGQARYDAALTAFQSELKTNPNDPNTLYNIAATYHQSAKTSLQSGHAATAQQRYEQAAQYYQLCLAKDANYTDAYRGLAALYMDCQNPDDAFQLLTGWYKANPVSAEPKLELARLYQEFSQICMIQGRTDQERIAVAQNCNSAAAALLQQILETDPTNYRALRALGYLKEQTGDMVGAVAEYQRSLQANSQQRDLESRIAALSGLHN